MDNARKSLILLTLLATTATVNGDCTIQEFYDENPCAGELSCYRDFSDAIDVVFQLSCLRMYYDYSLYSTEDDPFSHVQENFTITLKAEGFDVFSKNESSILTDLNDRITSIAITNGKIKKVPEAVSNLREATTVDLSNNEIGSLNLAAFSESSSLKVLNVSFNNIVHLDVLGSSASHGLVPINMIDLSHNNIQGVIQDCIPPYETLLHLNLSYNYIDAFHNTALGNLTGLLTLDISNNRIVELGSFLSGLVRLEELFLDHNKLTTINERNFYNMSALKNLNIRSNHLKSIEASSFQFLLALRQLDISNNKINILSKSMFQNNSLLRSLDVSFNNISKIESGAFSGAHIEDLKLHNNTLSGRLDTHAFNGLYFEKLDLSDADISELGPDLFGPNPSFQSLNFSKNYISKISKTTFRNLGLLVDLDLSYNKLEYIEFDMTDLKNLTFFYINNNFIKEIRNNMFKSLTSVTTIDLSNNAIKYIEMLSFENLKNLHNLYLQSNPLIAIPYQTFSGLTSCYSLDLSGTKIKTLQNNAFAGMESLNKLNLSYSDIKNLEFNTFNGTTSIEFLDLSHNKIESFSINNTNKKLQQLLLASNNITSISKISFQNLRQLSIIDLSDNRISKIQPGTFRDCVMLTKLNLSNNGLSFLQFGVFDGLENLETIDLSNNRFQRFDAKILFYLPDIQKVYLDNNFIDEINFNEFSIANVKTLSIGGNLISCAALMRLKSRGLGALVLAKTPAFDRENVNGITCNGLSEVNNASLPAEDKSLTQNVYLEKLINVDINTNRYLAAIFAVLLGTIFSALSAFVYVKFRSKLAQSRNLSASRQALSNAIELE